MKLNKFLLMGAIALGMIACKNNTELPTPNPNDAQANTYVAFSIAMPHSSARAAATDVGTANGGDTYVGTADEQEVKKVRVVLYDENNFAAYTFDFNPAAAHGNGDVVLKESEKLYITDAQKVEKKTYKALVLINPTGRVLDVTQRTMNLSEFETAVEATTADLMKDGFFMSNAEGLATVTEASMRPTKEEAEAAPFKDLANGVEANGIKVDRAVAKVFVGGTPTVVPPSLGATVEILGWTLDVTNRKLFWMRNFAKMVDVKDVFVPETKLINSSRWERYAKDPNFTSKDADANEYNYIVAPNATKTTRFVLAGESPEFMSTVIPTEEMTPASYEDAKGQYVLENTMEPWAQYAAVTTRVIIKASFVPKGYTKGESWYSFDNIKMKKDQFLGYVEMVKANPRVDLPAEAPTGLREAIKLASLNNKEHKFHDFTQDEAGNSYAMVFNNSNAGIDGKVLKFYKNAECYYAVKIRHFDDDQSSKMDYSFDVKTQDNGYGRYGVVRNNIYKLTLNTISQPGSPIVETPDPDEKDDVDDVWLSVKTEIMPWLVRVQSVEL